MQRLRTVITSFWFKVTLSAVLLALLLSRLDLGQLGTLIRSAHPGWLLVALAGYLLSQVISAGRWCLLARPLGFHEPFRRFLEYYFSGMFVNLFVPSTVGGDLNRTFLLAAGRKRRTLAATSVVADRGLGFVALAWIGAAAILLVRTVQLPAAFPWLAAVAAIACVVLWWWAPLAVVQLVSPTNRWRVLVERDLRPYRRDRKLLLAAFAIAGIFHTLQIATQMAIAWSLDINIPWPYFFVFVPIVNIAGMLPISLNGLGVREAGYWYFLGLIGIDREAAVALGLLSSTIVVLSGLAGAPMFLRRPSAQPNTDGRTPLRLRR